MRTRRNLHWLVAATLVFGLTFASPELARAGFEDGAAAYQQGNYDKALREWTPLAEKGNQQAQYNIGYMHFNGIGVPKEPSEAARWFAMAAEQGDASAQMSLGVMYGTGQGVSQDYSKAYIWLTLAAARLPYGEDRDQAVKNRDIVSAKMSRAEITEALGQALNWTPETKSVAKIQTAAVGTPQATSVASPPSNASAAPGSQIAAANGSETEARAAADAKAAAELRAANDAKAAAEAKAATETEARAAAEAKATAEIKAAEDATAAAEAKAASEAQARAAAESKAAGELKMAKEAMVAAEAKAAAETEARIAAEANAKAAADAQAAAPPAPPAPPAPANTQTAALTTGTGYLVQLASLRSMDAAQAAWSLLKKRHGDVLSGMEPVLQPIDLGTKGNFVRVHVGPFANQSEAGEVCRALQAQKQDCVVVSAKGRV